MCPRMPLFGLHLVILLCVMGGQWKVHALRFSFGTSTGDSSYASSSTTAPAISLPSAFVFYEDSYTTLYANVDGFISFNAPGTQHDVRPVLGDLDLAVICVFCTDIRPKSDRMVYYRLSTATSDLQIMQTLIGLVEDFPSSFTPTWVFVVTWDDVLKLQGSPPGNTMQIALASDGTTSMTYMEYDSISWIEGITVTGTFLTQVGFNKGTGPFYKFPQSRTEDLYQLNSTSNINIEGEFLFRVDQATITPPTIRTATIPPTTETPQETTAATTSTPTTTTSTPTKSDAKAYYIGFGIAGGLLLIVGIILIIFFVKHKSSSSAASSSAAVDAAAAKGSSSAVYAASPPSRMKVAPAPITTMDNGHHHPHYSQYDAESSNRREVPPKGVLALGSPFRIPRPVSSMSSNPSTVMTDLGSSSLSLQTSAPSSSRPGSQSQFQSSLMHRLV